jgi:hypothetical protein
MTFSVANEMCSPISARVKLVYITFSKFSYAQVWSLYFKCSNGFFAISGVFVSKAL